jgi:hypothetical protein
MSNTSGHFHSNKSNQTSEERRGSCRDGKGSSSSSLNDNSNPQQGTGVHRSPSGNSSSAKPQPAPQRVTLLIPPTVKDARKLFVGGLPSDGT